MSLALRSAPDTPIHWQSFIHPWECWAAMEADCRAAGATIELELYLFEDDAVGRRFLRVLWLKARQGVEIRLLFDSIGSWNIARSRRLKALRRRGVKVAFFNPLKLWQVVCPAAWFPRTHAKVLLIDSRILYSGGMCIDARMRDWWDMHLRLVDSAAGAEAAAGFDRLWRFSGCAQLHRPAPAAKEDGFHFLTRHMHTRRNAIYREVIHQTSRAHTRVRLATPYFIPGRLLSRTLKKLARRGVRVELMTSARSDVRVADLASMGYTASFLRGGGCVYHYTPSVMHAKMVIVDEDWATVGSMNLDHLSLFRNREANVIVTDRDTVAALNRAFDGALPQCRILTREMVKARSLLHRLASRASRFFRAFL